MPHTRHPAIGSFVCHHLATADLEAAAAFYGRLFGWSVRDIRVAGGLGAATFRSGDTEVATVGPPGPSGSPALWLPCLVVADVDATEAEVVRLGGTVAEAPGDASPGGPTIVSDPAGARFCLTEDRSAAGLGGDAAAPGRFCWAELTTGDPDASAAFYKSLAGWMSVERHRGREGRFWVFRQGMGEVAGMVQEPEPRRPAAWVPYVQVISAEESAELAQELGGAQVTPPGDIPGRGRYAVLRDPGGALVGVFALVEAA